MADGVPKGRIAEFEEIAKAVAEGGRVIDLGCGSGELLAYLKENKKIRETGIEISQQKINACVSKGLSVLQSDLDHGLRYPKKSFDTVLIINTLQTIHKPLRVLDDALKVGKQVVLVFPNFAQFPVRLYLLLLGKMPKSTELPYEWFDTPNIHLFTVQDLMQLCREKGVRIAKQAYFDSSGRRIPAFMPNFFAAKALLVLEK